MCGEKSRDSTRSATTRRTRTSSSKTATTPNSKSIGPRRGKDELQDILCATRIRVHDGAAFDAEYCAGIRCRGTWWSFTTQVGLPGTFKKYTPGTGTTGQPTNPILTWGTSSGATSYEYCYDTTANNICDGLWINTGTNTNGNLKRSEQRDHLFLSKPIDQSLGGLMKIRNKNIYHFLWLSTLIAALLLCGAPRLAVGGDWEWQNPIPQGNTLLDIWGSSGSNVFAVGANGTILHYNGSAWSLMTSGTTQALSGIWGSSGNDVFAVGTGGTILHYNGSAWSLMTSGTTQYLNRIWGNSGSDVFAVGGGGTILHYNGSAWSPMTSGTTQALNGIWGSSGSDVFAVGEARHHPPLQRQRLVPHDQRNDTSPLWRSGAVRGAMSSPWDIAARSSITTGAPGPP